MLTDKETKTHKSSEAHMDELQKLRDENVVLSQEHKRILERIEELKKNEAFKEKILDLSVNGMYIYDLVKGLNIYINQQYTNLTGYTLEDINGMTQEEFVGLFHPNERAVVLDHMREVINAGYGEVIEIEYRFKTADGRWMWCLSRDAVFEMDKDKNATQFMGTFIDITVKKDAEEALMETNRKLEQANRDLQEFSYVAAHDLKAPLTNLTTLAEMIDEKTFVSSQSQEIYARLKKSVHQMYSTVLALNDVIAFKTTLRDSKALVCFEDFFNEIKESISERLEETGTTIKADFSACPEVNYPPVHLKSIMQNLITNAVKYRIPNKALKIEIKSFKVDARACLAIKDNGLGFDSGKFGKKMMGLFTRLHTHVEGKGVGMYIVKSIVDSHGGKIEVDSKPGKGALFKIYLND